MKDYPVYIDHEEVRCSKCKSRLRTAPTSEKGFQGDGAYVKYCHDCSLFSWYDIKGEK